MEELVKKIMTAGFAVLFFVIMFPLTMLYYAWAGTLLWNWFMPVLDLPTLTMAQGYGIMLVIGFFTSTRSTYGNIKKLEDRESMRFLLMFLVAPILTVTIGAIVKHFCM